MFAPYHLLQLALGLIIWSLYFVALYAGLSLGCLYGATASGIGWTNLLVLLFTLLVATALFGLAWRNWRWLKRDALNARISQIFVARLGAILHSVAAFATLSVGAPALVLIPCL